MRRDGATILPTMLLAAWSFAPLFAVADTPVYSAGHADIGVDYLTGPSRFDLHIRFGSDVIAEEGAEIALMTLAPTAVAIRCPDPPILRETTDEIDLEGPEWDFLGVAVGEPIWFMPQTQQAGKPFFGFATDGLSPAQWSGPLSWSLESIVSSPQGGEVSLWQSDFFGNPSVKYASSNGILVVLDGDDDDQDDDFPQGIGGHDHYNWGFSKPGVYQVELGATANRIGVGPVHGSAIFTFLVGDAAGRTLDGDYDVDGDVDGADFLLWQRQLGDAVTAGAGADGNRDGVVDAHDLALWRDRFGAQAVGGSVASVPEPPTIGLIMIWMASSTIVRRRSFGTLN